MPKRKAVSRGPVDLTSYVMKVAKRLAPLPPIEATGKQFDMTLSFDCEERGLRLGITVKEQNEEMDAAFMESVLTGRLIPMNVTPSSGPPSPINPEFQFDALVLTWEAGIGGAVESIGPITRYAPPPRRKARTSRPEQGSTT